MEGEISALLICSFLLCCYFFLISTFKRHSSVLYGGTNDTRFLFKGAILFFKDLVERAVHVESVLIFLKADTCSKICLSILYLQSINQTALRYGALFP